MYITFVRGNTVLQLHMKLFHTAEALTSIIDPALQSNKLESNMYDSVQ